LIIQESLQKVGFKDFTAKLQYKRIYPYLYIIALIPFIISYFIYPLIFSLVLSFTNWNGIKLETIQFAGLINFIKLFKDEIFLKSLSNTFIFVFLNIIISNFFGFINAYILNYSGIKGSKIFRAIIFFPAVMAPVVVGLIWKIILSNDGLLNLILEKIGLGFLAINWLGNLTTPIFMVVLVNIWQYTGYNMILFHAGLQNVPDELIEAAKIDGANVFQIIRKIILPLLTPVITIILVLSIIGGFKVFDLVYALTKGGPAHASETISTYMIYEAFSFKGPSDMGYASSIAIFLTIIIFIFSYLRVRFTKEDIGD